MKRTFDFGITLKIEKENIALLYTNSSNIIIQRIDEHNGDQPSDVVSRDLDNLLKNTLLIWNRYT
jgi:hypothetical protein